MKNIYLLFIILYLVGCSSNSLPNNDNFSIKCPPILFSSEHKIYIGSSSKDITPDNIEYRGLINNAVFSKKCNIKNNLFFSELSILFILQPIIEKTSYNGIPFYVAILNQNKELQNIMYFSISGKFKKDIDSNKIIETEFIKKINLKHESIKESSTIVIGYVLDKKREEILN